MNPKNKSDLKCHMDGAQSCQLYPRDLFETQKTLNFEATFIDLYNVPM